MLRGYVAIVHKMEECAEHLVHFKQHAMINFDC